MEKCRWLLAVVMFDSGWMSRLLSNHTVFYSCIYELHSKEVNVNIKSVSVWLAVCDHPWLCVSLCVNVLALRYNKHKVYQHRRTSSGRGDDDQLLHYGNMVYDQVLGDWTSPGATWQSNQCLIQKIERGVPLFRRTIVLCTFSSRF